MPHSGVFYKEHDDFEPWRGQWDNNDKPVYVLKKKVNLKDSVKASPKLKIQELPAIQQHWSKIMEVIRDHGEQDAGTDGSDGSDSDPDGALFIDEEPATQSSHIRQKWKEGDAWWSNFINTETNFWSAYPKEQTECAYQLTQDEAQYVQVPRELTQRRFDAIDRTMSESILSAFDTLNQDLPEGLASSIAVKLAEVKKESKALYNSVGQAPNHLHLYSSEGTKPVQGTHYNANTDLQVGDMAIIKVIAEESSGQRGWDVVRVIRLDEGKVDCVYLMPSIKTLKYTTTHYPAWPPNWVDYKMQPIKVGKQKQWAGTVSFANVQFSFPYKGDKIPGKYIHSVQMACIAIANTTTPDALESDADVCD